MSAALFAVFLLGNMGMEVKLTEQRVQVYMSMYKYLVCVCKPTQPRVIWQHAYLGNYFSKRVVSP